jgi:tyrosyl-tRNA synthetase
MLKKDFLHEATERGFIHQCTDIDGLKSVMKNQISGYIGFDWTADSLHVGSLVQIRLLQLLARHNHQPVYLIGSATTKIGDPSFRSEARQMLANDQIKKNAEGIQNALGLNLFNSAIPNFSQPKLVDNSLWFDNKNYVDLLREVGPHFSVNRMLTFDSVKSRLDREQGLSFLEFNYSIMQAYDFLSLAKSYNVTLQIGGSDQWGNIVSGVDLIRRVLGKQVFGLTTPLLTTASGDKMGKTASGAVWLSATKTPVFDFWNYWRNVEDADVGKFLKLFTDINMGEIARLEALQGAEINEAKKALATHITASVHGWEAANNAAETARANFEDMDGTGELPRVKIEISGGVSIFRLLVLAGLSESYGAARRLIRSGGARLADEVVQDENMIVSETLLRNGVKLSSGKKNHRLVDMKKI